MNLRRLVKSVYDCIKCTYNMKNAVNELKSDIRYLYGGEFTWRGVALGKAVTTLRSVETQPLVSGHGLSPCTSASAAY